MRFILSLLAISSTLLCYVYGDEKSFVPVDFWESMQYRQPRPTDQELVTLPCFIEITEIYQKFSVQQLKESFYDYSLPPEDSSIPAIIHFIWLGSELPYEAQVSIHSWENCHLGWIIKIWRDNDLENFKWASEKSKRNFYSAKSYAEKADILRLEILYQFGGIYSDTDVICLKPFHDLITSGFQFFAGLEVNYVSRITKNPIHVGTAIMGAQKGSETIKYCIDHQVGVDESPTEHILNRTGPGLCSRAVMETLKDNDKILILPISYFYPFPFEHRSLSFDKAMTYRARETLAIHLWSGSWLSKEELERIKQKAILQGWIKPEDEE